MSIENLVPMEQFLQMSWLLAPFLLQVPKSNTVRTQVCAKMFSFILGKSGLKKRN